jgi:pimeloyl-ACP methyl ester carboxylesterase
MGRLPRRPYTGPMAAGYSQFLGFGTQRHGRHGRPDSDAVAPHPGRDKRVVALPVGSDEWIEDLFVDQACLGWKHIKLARGVFPSGFGDHELRQLSMPTLLLEGEQTPAYSAQSAIDRARELIPQIQAEIIAGAGEILPIEQPDAVNRRLTEDI